MELVNSAKSIPLDPLRQKITMPLMSARRYQVCLSRRQAQGETNTHPAHTAVVSSSRHKFLPLFVPPLHVLYLQDRL